jgi:predicted RNA-binding Zn-ribbon protein involved in translation (DUF1610 family)
MEDNKDLEKTVEEETIEAEGAAVPEKPQSAAPEAEAVEEKEPETVNINKEELKKQLVEAYTDLGEKFYKEVCQPLSGRPRELPRPSLFTDQVAKIKSIKEKIDTIVSAELAAKGLKACPDCENEVVLASKFCNMCGYRFPVRNEDKKMRPTPVPRCKQCGANLEPDSVFCPDCGKRQ